MAVPHPAAVLQLRHIDLKNHGSKPALRAVLQHNNSRVINEPPSKVHNHHTGVIRNWSVKKLPKTVYKELARGKRHRRLTLGHEAYTRAHRSDLPIAVV